MKALIRTLLAALAVATFTVQAAAAPPESVTLDQLLDDVESLRGAVRFDLRSDRRSKLIGPMVCTEREADQHSVRASCEGALLVRRPGARPITASLTLLWGDDGLLAAGVILRASTGGDLSQLLERRLGKPERCARYVTLDGLPSSLECRWSGARARAGVGLREEALEEWFWWEFERP